MMLIQNRFRTCNTQNARVEQNKQGRGVRCSHCNAWFLKEKHWKAHIKSNLIKANRPRFKEQKIAYQKEKNEMHRKKHSFKVHFRQRAGERLGIQITESDYEMIKKGCKEGTYELLQGLGMSWREVRKVELYGMEFRVVYDRFCEELVTVLPLQFNF